MANPQKRKGDAAEREAAQLLSDLLGLVVRRKLGTAAAARLKPDEAALQAEHAAVPFAATLVRFRGGTWRVVLTPEQWATYVRLILREGLL
jgi:hypothetical protein